MAIDSKDIHKIIVACDAGMGSSVMLASTLKKQLKGTGVTVEHTPVNSIPEDADVVVCHTGLAARAKAAAPGKPLVSFQIFLGDPAVTKLVNTIKNGGTVDA
ncbi:PTS lactose transporter subunit IIB [Nonomuraea fuscirosea]|jgi:mannitol-specific phosphotransferase system IIBC component|uniref:PTS system mannitol-specific IIB component n=1 Tax=Nonomuraea fuscirosea TaxID=1291556 RepID=A0A2T0N4T5_9ACTN|nr:PTS lactose transporter subunit IIB [Nonomuraea fuscirosea]PRX67381.1 PTS system mannitol-specific IIB component [Nonomuraea fuscirosea]WSA57601.1 PTS lactose transporter subunit IIB [Nonomuraea fuscirosea]